MSKEVLIKVTGNQVGLDGKDRCIEMITTGTLSKNGQTYELEYEESELSGMQGTTTRIQVEGEFVSLNRTGEYPSQMVFLEGQKYINQFETVAGNVQLGVYPTFINTNVSEEKGEIKLRYLMDIEGRVQSSNQLDVEYKKQLKRSDLNLDN